MQPNPPADVAATLAGYPPLMRKKLAALRTLIFDVAAKTAGVGSLHETLKWGEPAFITAESKSGSTIRIAWKPKAPTQYAMYFSCQTTLVDSFKTMFPTAFTFAGNRALLFALEDEVPVEALRICVEMALTYNLKANTKKRERV